jgi:CubicO group peptidase (beta-lactamase class C family)
MPSILSCLAFLQVLASPAGEPVEADERPAALAAVVSAWHEAGLFDGAVLVADEGELLWQGAAGLAVREWEQPNAPDVRYPIASLTKQFTALLVMRAVERGDVRLEDRLSDVLPWYRADTGDRISLRDLLSHASGLPDTPWQLYADPEAPAQDARRVAEVHCSGDLLFEPGTAFRYGNADYHLLGAVLEELHGQPFEQLLQEQILDPLGMQDTGVARRESVVPRRAQDYVPVGDDWQRAPAFFWETWGAAGALDSTVGDLHRWNRALARFTLLSEPMTRLMFTPREDVGDVGNYVALGSWVYERPLPGLPRVPTLVERRGAIGGFASLNLLVLGEDQWVVILANSYNEDIHSLPWAECLPLDLLLVLRGGEPKGPPGGD